MHARGAQIGPTQRNEEWTKINFILPLLDGLGWDRFKDVNYEDSSQDVEGRLDFILMCQPSVGIEAKALDVVRPQHHGHSHIMKGLKQSKERGTSYFIWTNGDCWQFFSHALPDAPIYQLILSRAGGGAEQVESVADKLLIIEKRRFTDNPESFDTAIRKNWEITALPAAWKVLLENHAIDLLQLVRQGLPSELEIEDEKILDFLKTLQLPDVGRPPPPPPPPEEKIFPYDWEQLLTSFEPKYEKDRGRFFSDYYRTFGRYLISEKYQPWSHKTTWRHAGLPDNPNEKKKCGNIIVLFKEWQFIEKVDGARYQRVEEKVPYLIKLLEKTASPQKGDSGPGAALGKNGIAEK